MRDLLIELEKSVRGRDQFLAMLSHELRNPLAAILTAAQLMERRDAAVFASERAIVQRQARLLARLVDDLLDVSRVTHGAISLAVRPLDLGEVVARTVETVRAVVEEGGRQVTVLTEPV